MCEVALKQNPLPTATGALPPDREPAGHKGLYLQMTFCIVIFFCCIFKFYFYDLSFRYCSQEKRGMGRTGEARPAAW